MCEALGAECAVLHSILSPGGYQGEGISVARLRAEMGSPWSVSQTRHAEGLQKPAKCATIGKANKIKRDDGESTRCAPGTERGSTGCKGPQAAAARKFAPERPAGTAAAREGGGPVVRDGVPRYRQRVPRSFRTLRGIWVVPRSI